MSENVKLSKQQLQQTREMDDFDLTMFLSEIKDNGWESALTVMSLILMASERHK